MALSCRGASRSAPTSIDSNAAMTSDAEDGLSVGPFSSSRRTSISNAGGTSGLCHVGATGGVLRCWPIMATSLSPRNGGLPVTISYSMAPREYRSARGVTSPPMACSGGMYRAVPTIMPSWVRRERSLATARPKSPILAVPSAVRSTLPGLRSRWTMPFEWANSRPRHVALATSMACSRARRLSSATSSTSRSMSSVTM